MLDKLAKDYDRIAERVKAGKLPLVARIPAIKRAVDEYAIKRAEFYEQKRAEGVKIPLEYRHDGRLLEQFADLILYEELTWSHPDKMTIIDYPIMTHWQEELRDEKYIKREEISYRDRQYNGRRKACYFGKNGEVGVANPKMPDRYDAELSYTEDKVDMESFLMGADLTDRQRQVIDLIFFEDVTQEDAAEELGVSQQAVKKHLDAALKKLRRRAGVASMF